MKVSWSKDGWRVLLDLTQKEKEELQFILSEFRHMCREARAYSKDSAFCEKLMELLANPQDPT